ncbi:MAG: glycosyl transferase family 2 [Candidatus Moranbacteria bacterium RIFCSPHIGHO2_12_FULL_40_10]|nr:MAG: glycosyl transferase family 2 [Candidatus Moranbacteria bacterium RIFCSPHIGHO2_12_FULL_40_10]
MSEKPYLSIIAPLYNEEGNVKKLHEKIVGAMNNLTPSPALSQRARGSWYEIIFVDDGSADNTVKECEGLIPLKLIKFRKNFGQTAAFDAGIKNSSGEIIITMDGDMQNDPNDIKLLIEELDKGYDVVSGWRWKRKDSLLKKIFSRGANLLRKILVKDNIHDSGCSLKAYRRECFEDMDLFGEMHRFIPAMLQLQGFRVGEAKVNHLPRVAGKTKYNWKRSIKGFTDMLAIWFWRKYSSRPLHLFGGGGIIFSLAGVAILIWMAVIKIFYGASLSEKIWPMVGVFLMLVGIQLFVSGLLADIAIKNYYKNRNRMNYTIKEIREQ